MENKKKIKQVLMCLSLSALLFGAPAFAGQGPGGPGGGPPPGNLIEDFDQDGDGQVSQDEFQGSSELFTKMDANSDGYISEDEASQCPQGGPPPGMGNPFENDDQDGDGKISKEEFSGPSEMFEQMDSDGDGYIEEGEKPQGPPPGHGGQES